MKLKNLFMESIKENLKVAIISLDQQNAFDRVEHKLYVSYFESVRVWR